MTSNPDSYITNSHYSRAMLEMRCPKCDETFYCLAETEYGRTYIDDSTCPSCHIDLEEVGEADMGSKWDMDDRV